jgi:hypothetical protein
MCKRFYFTTDPLNALSAERLAEQKGIALEVVDPRDLPWIASESIELGPVW